MFYLGYITLYLLQTKLKTTAQIPIAKTPEPIDVTNDDLWPEDTLFPKDGPVFIHGLQETNHQITRKTSNQKDEERHIERRFGPLIDIPGVEPKSYVDSYSLALGPQNQDISALKYKTDFPQKNYIAYTATQEIVKKARQIDNAQTTMTVGVYALYLNETQNHSKRPFLRFSDTQTHSTLPFIYSDTQTRSTMPFIYSDTQTRSTMPFKYLDSQTRSTTPFIYSDSQTRSTMPFIYSNTQTRSTMPFKYSDTQTRSTKPFIYSDSETRSTMPFIYSDPQTRSTMPFIYSDSQTRSTMPFIYSDTQTSSTMLFVYSNTLPRSTIPFIYSDTQTRSTVPFTSPDKTITKSNVNKKTYSATERNIIRNMPIQKGNDPFINVYNYMQNHHVTSPDGKDAKRLKRPLKYNLKPRPLDGTHHSIINKDLKYFDYGTSETPVKRIHATQKSKSGFMKDEIERFSRSTNRPGLDSHFDVTKSLKSRIERFKIPLQKLASIKANFYNGEDNPFKKEIELVNNEGNIFNEPYTTSSDKVNENERFKNAVLFRSNVGHDSSKIERLENTDVTQTEWYPWIKTGAAIHNRASYMAHLPEIQTTASPIYPWILTKMFTVSTTERYQKLTSKPTFMYEYKELNPEKALRMRPETEERLNSDRQETTQKIQITPRVEPDLEYSQTTGLQEVESEPFSMFLAKLMKILASKTLKDLKGLISPFERAITTLLDSGKLIKLGMTTGSFIAQMTTSLIAPMKEIQRHIFIMQISLENRQRMLDDTFNAMLDELDNVYDVSEEEAMQRILHEAMVYPNTSKTGEQIVQGFLEDVFLHPMNRIAGTAHGNVVFENIAKVANKYNTPIEPIARRYENQYQITKYNKFRNGRIINDENKFIHSHSTKNQGRRKNKHKEKEDTSIGSHFDDEEHEDESSSNDNTGVEIKIQINNKKHSKRNKRRIFKKNTGNNVYTRITDEYDSELFATANTQIINQGLTNGDLRKYAKHRTKEHLSGRKSNSGEMGKPKTKDEDRQTVKSNVDSKGTNESKVTLQFDCEPLPVIVSKKSNRRKYTSVTKSEMIMYCSNARDNN